MSLTVTCPECDKTLKVKDEAAGKKIKCPGCSAVIPVPAKKASSDDDDDFLSGLNQVTSSKRQGRKIEEEDDEDEEEEEAPRRSKPKASKPAKSKKKSSKKKSGGPNYVLYGTLSGCGVIVALLVAMFIASVNQIRKVAQGQAQANWTTFKHPSGVAQIDMPGTPTFNASQSVNGSQTYSLERFSYRMSLTAITLPMDAQLALTSNPAALDLMFNEMSSKTTQQLPGSRMISSRRFNEGTIPCLEMKVDVKGNINLMRFYVFQTSLVGAEFITRTESVHAADRDKFFNSMRGPDGNLINAAAQQQSAAQTSAAPPGGSAPTTTPALPASSGAKQLSEFRKTVRTNLTRQDKSNRPVPNPPPALANLVSYNSASGQLAAYVTTIPQDGKKYPAIIWISGGDCNSIDDGFFQDAPAKDDQTASAFRKAGIVTMYPSLRGGNMNPGFKEGFFGEVEDVNFAADYLANLPGIDPNRIYLGGHSTGGTLALLVSESTGRFRAVFSFGPVEDIRGYGNEFVPFNFRNAAELDVRTPSKWLDSVTSKTFVIEGMKQPGNASSLKTMSQANHNPQLMFVPVANANHFNILAPVTKVIADKINRDVNPTVNITLDTNELNLPYAN